MTYSSPRYAEDAEKRRGYMRFGPAVSAHSTSRQYRNFLGNLFDNVGLSRKFSGDLSDPRVRGRRFSREGQYCDRMPLRRSWQVSNGRSSYRHSPEQSTCREQRRIHSITRDLFREGNEGGFDQYSPSPPRDDARRPLSHRASPTGYLSRDPDERLRSYASFPSCTSAAQRAFPVTRSLRKVEFTDFRCCLRTVTFPLRDEHTDPNIDLDESCVRAAQNRTVVSEAFYALHISVDFGEKCIFLFFDHDEEPKIIDATRGIKDVYISDGCAETTRDAFDQNVDLIVIELSSIYTSPPPPSRVGPLAAPRSAGLVTEAVVTLLGPDQDTTVEVLNTIQRLFNSCSFYALRSPEMRLRSSSSPQQISFSPGCGLERKRKYYTGGDS